MHHLRELEPTDPTKPVMVPGDPERNSMRMVRAKGAILYTEDHIRTYRELAKNLKVPPMQHFQAQTTDN
jgi:LDH2 family malate/lactate/ureidoglycolate dehydrogenase